MDFRNGDEPTMAEVQDAIAIAEAPVTAKKEAAKKVAAKQATKPKQNPWF